MLLGISVRSSLLEKCDNLLANCEAVDTDKIRKSTFRRHFSAGAEYADEWDVDAFGFVILGSGRAGCGVAEPKGVVIQIVSGGNLDGSSAHFWIDKFGIRDYGNLDVIKERVLNVFVVKMLCTVS